MGLLSAMKTKKQKMPPIRQSTATVFDSVLAIPGLDFNTLPLEGVSGQDLPTLTPVGGKDRKFVNTTLAEYRMDEAVGMRGEVGLVKENPAKLVHVARQRGRFAE